MSSRYNKWIQREELRLIKYQHQHRGLSFDKLFLPPTTDREVNIVGLDNHIYRGRIPRVREDQLPPEVDATAIDEQKLYEEIRDMNFPPVPPQEPLGPCRRIGGQYTLGKKLTLAPVKVDCGAGLEETLILGRDGGVYKGTAKYESTIELDKKIRGTKRVIRKVRQRSESDGIVEPAIVALQGDGRLSAFGSRQAPSVQLPIANLGKIRELIKGQSKVPEKIDAQETEDLKNKQETKITDKAEESKDTEDAQETEDTEAVQETGDTVDTQETKATEIAQETEDTEDAQEAEDTEDAQETEDTEDAQETEDTEDAQDTEDTEDAQETDDTEDAQDTLDLDDQERDGSKEQDTLNTDKAKKIKDTEEAENFEEAPDDIQETPDMDDA